jgi:zinc D-Ala-D-Ala carboxypeptidase
VQRLRDVIGPLSTSSGYRSPEHSLEQAKVHQGKPLGTHTLDRAIDLQASFGAAFEIATKADQVGFTGIGIKQHGPTEGRFILLDDLGTGELVGVWPSAWRYYL